MKNKHSFNKQIKRDLLKLAAKVETIHYLGNKTTVGLQWRLPTELIPQKLCSFYQTVIFFPKKNKIYNTIYQNATK